MNISDMANQEIPNYPKLAYNKYANILLCTSCHIGIPTNEVETHMWKSHHEKVSEADVRRDFLAHGVTLPSSAGKYPPAREGRHGICEPVQGLLMYLGYFCLAPHDGEVCAHAVRKEKSFTNHYGHVHKGESFLIFHAFILFGLCDNRKNSFGHQIHLTIGRLTVKGVMSST
jgi:hypothetical protein